MDELKEIREALEAGKKYQEFAWQEGQSPFDGDTPFNKAIAALSRLEAREVKALKNAREPNIRDTQVAYFVRGCVTMDAAYRAIAAYRAEIQTRLAVAPKTVPMAMLREVWDISTDTGEWPEYAKAFKAILARYGYTVEP